MGSNDLDADPCNAGSARGQGECAKRKLDQHNKAMLAIYAQLIDALPQDDGGKYSARVRLTKAQTAWIHYRHAMCSFEGSISGGAPIWQSTRTVYCLTSFTEDRIMRLRAYLACAKEEPDACKEFV